MTSDLIQSLPLPQRLALSYAPRAAYGANLALLGLDQRLGSILRSSSEPVLSQIKLAWWRERLAEKPADWPEGEPLLALLVNWPGDVAALGSLVDGWEKLLADKFDTGTALAFADGRAVAWQAMAAGLGSAGEQEAEACARQWALIDLASNLGTQTERDIARKAAIASVPQSLRLPRALRPLKVLHALAQRSLKRGSDDLLTSPVDGLVALRVGIIGR